MAANAKAPNVNDRQILSDAHGRSADFDEDNVPLLGGSPYDDYAPYSTGGTPDGGIAAMQADIDNEWDAGYRAALGETPKKGRGRGKNRARMARDDGYGSASEYADQASGRQRDGSMAGSPSRSWNVVPGAYASDHVSGPLSSSRHYVPMVPLEEIADLPVPQGYPGEEIAHRARARRPEQVIAGMSRTTFNLALLVLVLCILAVPALIGLNRLAALSPTQMATPVSQATIVPTPPLADGFAGFLNDNFSIAYPANWQHDGAGDSAHGVEFTDGKDTAARISIIVAVPSTELQQHMDDVARGFRGAVPQTISSGIHRTYNKAEWLESDYIVTVVKGSTAVQFELRVLTTDHGAYTYDILLSSPRTQFSQANSSYFGPMLESFRFQ